MTQYKNTHQQGIAPEDIEGSVLLQDGVSPTRGVPYIDPKYIEAQRELTGIPMGHYIPVPSDEEETTEPVQCGANTKKGNPCKGKAILPGLFCMVHDI